MIDESEEGGRLLIVGNVLVIVLMFLVGIYYYLILPETVPMHFGFSGRPDRYGSKNEIMIIPFLLSITQLTFLIMFKFRFRMWRFLNVPIDLSKLDERRRAIAVNRYFELLLRFSFGLGLCLLLLEVGSFECMKIGRLTWWYYVLLLPIFLLIIPFMISYSRLNEELKQELGL